MAMFNEEFFRDAISQSVGVAAGVGLGLWAFRRQFSTQMSLEKARAAAEAKKLLVYLIRRWHLPLFLAELDRHQPAWTKVHKLPAEQRASWTLNKNDLYHTKLRTEFVEDIAKISPHLELGEFEQGIYYLVAVGFVNQKKEQFHQSESATISDIEFIDYMDALIHAAAFALGTLDVLSGTKKLDPYYNPDDPQRLTRIISKFASVKTAHT